MASSLSPRPMMPSNAHHESHSAPRASLGLAAFEVVLIFLIFYLFAGSPPPDVGESHYLVKAKHYWQPEWCAGDLFLESRDAHWTFYWTFGWITKFCSLTATAWIGRAITWLLLAWSWQRLSGAVVPRPLISLLSAGLMLVFLRYFHLAGEWIVGGVEAKGFAYVLVFLALEAIVRDRWRAALLLAGTAGAFHVLVGGWTAVAIALAWVFAGRERPALTSILPAALGGFILSLPGLIGAAALSWGVPDEIGREAAKTYVFERLSHHLVFHRFAAWNQSSFMILVAVWLALARHQWTESRLRRLHLVVAGTLVIAIVGIVIDQFGVIRTHVGRWSIEEYALRVAPWLRYYFFRMSDSLVPIGTALGIVVGICRLASTRPALANYLWIATILLAAGNIADVCYWRSQQRLPGAILQPRPTADSWPRWWFQRPSGKRSSQLTAAEWNRDWRAVCNWINQQTPADAKFITPREQQTFKWYAQRAEVASWKDIPQDARGLVAWKQVLETLYPRNASHRLHDLAAFSDTELVALAREFGASFIVIGGSRSTRPIGLTRIYPQSRAENPSFEVYRIPSRRNP